ncbi:helix-turn-helix domain-containing protein [Cohnella endophytica]|uniref:Helix-turn-helix domain-containing protein n=1 Tax=Cohnella endophytica TaxID=2419778 RepID=A0A494XQV1_9BACL|nr:helix-turn-helix domain-containing protein [Cohnella endophytica]RKP53007.1 helix-turn-helix domain-containing protein [Cohnella endophytica]
MPEYNRPAEYNDTSDDAIIGGHFDEDDTYTARRPSGMNDSLIVFTLSGEGYFRTPAGEKSCGAGQLVLLRSGVPHEYGTVAGTRWNFVWAHFQKLPETDYLPPEEVFVHDLPEGHLRNRVYRAFQNLLQDSRDRSGFRHALCENSIREILLLVAQRTSHKQDSRIEHALQLLSRSMHEELRIHDLARSVGLSPSRLSHLFREETGESIVEYLNHMRLRQAALLMEHMGRTATEASFDVGFNNYNHFAALFRRVYGVSPRNYAKALRSPTGGSP